MVAGAGGPRDDTANARRNAFVWLLVLVTALGLVTVAVHSKIILVSLLVIPPSLAVLSLTGPQAAAVAVYAFVWALIGGLVAGIFSGPGRGSTLISVAVVGAASTVAAGRRSRREMSYRRISRVAEAAQATIVRPIPAKLGSLTFATVYRSAAEEARVGGDAYAAVNHPDGVRLLIADVRGKGLDAVAVAADLLASFREVAPGRVELPDLARHLEQSLLPGLGPEDFVTALLVQFLERHVALVSCGHPWPLIRRGTDVQEVQIDRPSPPLGLGVRPLLQTHPFSAGDQMLVFTDGLVEARDGQGRFFDPVPVLAEMPDVSVRELLDRLVAALDSHAGGALGDDLAVVLVEYSEEPAPDPVVEGVRMLNPETMPAGH
ncbi:MAG TPA: PP2C family protein-serine/threonine phosphatase [Mycobacteriales bacterium]